MTIANNEKPSISRCAIESFIEPDLVMRFVFIYKYIIPLLNLRIFS